MNPLMIFMMILPHVPDVISFVEKIHGNAPGNGATKLAMAVNLLVSLVPDLEGVFNVSPDRRAALEKIIAIAVTAMNGSGLMPQVGPAAPAQTQQNTVG